MIINIPAGFTPGEVGQRLLFHIKQGKSVEKIVVWFTRQQVHQFFPQMVERNPETFQLETWIAKGTGGERYIDMRLWEHPWHITLAPGPTRQPYQKPKVDPVAQQRYVAELDARDARIAVGFLQ